MESEETTAVCRVCLKEFQLTECSHIFTDGVIGESNTNLAELLNYCTGLEFVEEDTELPDHLCKSCTRSLIRAYGFKKAVLDANDLLRGQEVFEIALTYQLEDGVQRIKCEKNIDIPKTEMVNEDDQTNTVVEYGADELQELAIAAQIKRAMETEDMTLTDLGDEGDMVELTESEEPEEHRQIANEVQNEQLPEEVVYVADEFQPMEENEFEISESEFLTAERLEEEDEDNRDIESLEDSNLGSYFADGDEIKAGLHSESSQDEMRLLKPIKPRNVSTKPKPRNPDLQCKVCGKQLSNTNSYKYHMQLHSDATPYLCSLCGEGFKTRNAYEGHIVIHDPNNPNTCELCGKSYRQASSLRAHMLTHSGIKPFICDICGKGMTQKSGYKKHMLTHTGEKPHVCDICGRDFRYSSNLIAHKRSHSEEKPYSCSHCDKSFHSMEQLKRHSLVHLSVRPYSCEVCGKTFKRRSSLSTHKHTHSPLPDACDQKILKSNVVELY